MDEVPVWQWRESTAFGSRDEIQNRFCEEGWKPNMSEMKSIVWRLYAMRPTDENVENALKERFHRLTTKYILVYTGEKHEEEDIAEISQENYDALSKDDAEWLSACNTTILREFQEKHSDTIQQAQLDFLKEFQQELEREQERLNGRE